jgi:hypothetical protein
MVTTMKAAGISAFFISHFKPSLYGWSTMLQAERPQVQILMRSLDFFNLPNLSSLTIALGLKQTPTEMSTKNILSGSK